MFRRVIYNQDRIIIQIAIQTMQMVTLTHSYYHMEAQS